MPFGLGFFAAAGAVAGGSYEHLTTQIIGGTSTLQVDFTNLSNYSANYKHLQFRLVMMSNNSADITMFMTVNDIFSQYSWHRLTANGSGSPSSSAGWSANGNSDQIIIGTIAGNSTANKATGYIIDVLDPFVTTKFKTFRSIGGSAPGIIELASGNVRTTNAINKISFLGNGFAHLAGSRLSLYGIKGA